MQYKPSDRYTELRGKLVLKQKLTPEEIDEFKQLIEEEKIREAKFSKTIDGFYKHENESRRKADLQKVKFISEIRRDTKKRLSPLGIPKKEPEEGQ